jgi:hypothetical protein
MLSIGECPSNSPFLKYNGAEAPRPIVFKEWRDTRTLTIEINITYRYKTQIKKKKKKMN